MTKILLIVESPAKAKTISKYLGNNYIIKASYGHICDLDKKNLGIDVENNFKPNYKLISTKSKIIKDLIDTSKKVDKILLASDEDREGEAISYHICRMLKMKLNENNRITFHEITKTALENAVNNPRTININEVNSQQTRRILDRIVGFKLSPILWKHINPKLSAGRVQSVCLKLVIEKENEITNHIDKYIYQTKGYFTKNLVGILNKNFDNKDIIKKFLEDIKDAIFKVSDNKKIIEERKPPAPFTTSTIVQEVNTKYNINPKMCMSILQKLYETGKITYHRTDSTNLSNDILNNIKDYIINKYTDKYYQKRIYKSSQKNAQEAHEAIRPTNILNISLNEYNEIEKKVYNLIWCRTIASQMSNAVYEKYSIHISISNKTEEYFIANNTIKIFDGYTIIYNNEINNDENNISNIDIKVGTILKYNKIECQQKYDNLPIRYNEGSLVKKMEKLGIGRPSTYANIIDTIITRDYVKKENIKGIEKICDIFILKKDIEIKQIKQVIGNEKNKFVPTFIGIEANKFLCKNFETLLDYNFTSNLEKKLDDISHGKYVWTEVLKDFYDKFINNISKIEEIDNKKYVGLKDGKKCYIYISKYGPVLQIGEKDEKKYINLEKDIDINNFKLEDLNNIISYPKLLGQYKNIDIIVKKGKFGEYVEYNKKNYNIDDEITLENVIKVIKNKDKILGNYKGYDIEIKNGKFGDYIVYNKKNYSIKDEITLENAINIIENKDKILGKYKNIDIIIKKGKFGDYFVYNKKNYSIKDEITLENAIKIIENKDKILGKYKNKDIIVKKGQYGNYIVYNNKNYSIKEEITLENAIKVIDKTID